MKKITSLVSSILLISILTSGCSSIGIGKRENDNITIKIMVPSDDYFSGYKKYFEEQFPQIKFEVISIRTLIQSDNTPPEKSMERWDEIIKEEKVDFYYDVVPEMNGDEDPLVDLSTLITRDQLQFNEIQQHMIDANKSSNDAVRSLSPTFDRKVLFMNRTLFKDNGINEPENPMTFSDFRQSASQLKEQNATAFGYDLNLYSWLYTLKEYGETTQGLTFIRNNQLLIDQPEWAELALQLLEDYKSSIMRNENHTLTKADRSRIGMTIDYASNIYNYISDGETTDTLAIMDLPVNPSNPVPNPYYQRASFSISKESKHINELWEIIKFVMSEEAAADIAASMLSPGFVTYPQFVQIGDFKMESFTGSVIGTPTDNTSRLSYDTSSNLQPLFDEKFNSYIKDEISFEMLWSEIERLVQDTNSNPDNFYVIHSNEK